MATSFDVIEDMGLGQINDYTLSKLYTNNFKKFQKFCDGMLITAVSFFKDCRHSLEYDLVAREFVNDLTNEEIAILSDFWMIQWFSKKVNDSSQFQAKLQNW